MSRPMTRRIVFTTLPAVLSGLGVVATLTKAGAAQAADPEPSRLRPDVPLLASSAGDAKSGLSRNAEAIHQEVFFKATCKRVFEALVDTAQFDRVTKLSAAMSAGPPPGAKPTQISAAVGGTFLLFGGQISGRQVELVTHSRIVQAWRVANWDPGDYSIAHFELREKDSGTQLIFDHRGFPNAAGQHLAEGWYGNYWEPLAKFLA